MLNDIKAGLKLLKYGLQAKTMFVMLIMFFVLGTAMELFANDVMSNMGGMYLVIVGTYLYQLVITTSIANVIQSSAMKKKIQTYLPSLFCTVTITVMYLFFAALRYFRTVRFTDFSDPEQVAATFSGLLIAGMLALVMQIYNGVTYKFFMPSMVIMLLVMIPIMVLGMKGTTGAIRLGNIAYPSVYIIAGLGMVLLGGIIGYIISLAVYRKEIDPKTYKAAMARAGK